jgi:hypothetical protein
VLAQQQQQRPQADQVILLGIGKSTRASQGQRFLTPRNSLAIVPAPLRQLGQVPQHASHPPGVSQRAEPFQAPLADLDGQRQVTGMRAHGRSQPPDDGLTSSVIEPLEHRLGPSHRPSKKASGQATPTCWAI